MGKSRVKKVRLVPWRARCRAAQSVRRKQAHVGGGAASREVRVAVALSRRSIAWLAARALT